MDDRARPPAGQKPLPLYLSRLPAAAALMPYLQEIDANRRHANFGPLEARLAAAIARHHGLAEGSVALTANGSLALVHALAAAGARPGGLCILPAWTYAATAAAASAAGLEPWFLDVDADTWALDPDAVADALAGAPATVGAVIVVAPFGNPADIAAWEGFRDNTGVPVVIDAAGGFDSLVVGRVPTMVSLHAAKAFAVGEGGLVACADLDLVRRVRGLSNHGFTAPGEAGLRGVNAKMSEYHAAVGLAALDAWADTRAEFARLKRAYADALADVPGLTPAPGDDAEWVTSTYNVVLPGDATPLIAALNEHGIGARRWWAAPLHRQPAYADCRRADLPVTERLAARVMGVPYFLGMDGADVARVAAALADALAGDS